MSDNSEDFSGLDDPFNWDNSDQDYLPGDTDVEPTYLGSLDLLPESPGALTIHIYTDGSDVPLKLSDLNFAGLSELLGLNTVPDRNPDFTVVTTDNFDQNDPAVKAPFFDRESLERWLDVTALWELAEIFYDQEHDLWYVRIESP